MPKVWSERGCDIFINTHDHLPPHVHVVVGGGTIIINLADSSIRKIIGKVKQNDIRKAQEIVSDNQAFLVEKWQNIHG